MAEFIKAAVIDEIPVGGKKLVEVDERLVILFHIEANKFCCIDDICTHDGGALSDGEVIDGAIACPRHGARFDICTGKVLCMPATRDTASHEVKVDGGQIFVKLND